MKTLILTILGASIANILTWAISAGFKNSYWGKNIREEVSRVFNSLTKHVTKGK